MFTKCRPAEDSKNKPVAVTCLQADNTLFLADAKFQELEEEASKRFQRKQILKLAVGSTMKFN